MKCWIRRALIGFDLIDRIVGVSPCNPQARTGTAVLTRTREQGAYNRVLTRTYEQGAYEQGTHSDLWTGVLTRTHAQGAYEQGTHEGTYEQGTHSDL